MPDAIHVHAVVPERALDLDVRVPDGSTLAVVGPNGAGKSSLLQLISGELRPDPGLVTVHGVPFSGPVRHVPPHRRRFGHLEQRPLLFPHLTVADNVAFGLRARGTGQAEATARALAELDAVGCEDLAARRPAALSGGQAQRVSLARALAVDPEVMLLDEPLAALDATVAPELRRLLRDRLAGVTTVLATHDLLDVVALADDMIELGGGRVLARGPVDDLCQRPSTPFLAGFVGVNLLHGTSRGGSEVWIGDDLAVAGSAAQPLPPGPARAVFSPAAVSVFAQAPHGSPRNEMPAVVVHVEDRWPAQRVVLDVVGQRIAADLTPQSVAELGLGAGVPVTAVLKATQVTLHPGAHPQAGDGARPRG